MVGAGLNQARPDYEVVSLSAGSASQEPITPLSLSTAISGVRMGVDRIGAVCALALVLGSVAGAADDDWPRWRGPKDDGMARGDAPIEWTDSKNVAWRVPVPGRGHSSPVIWGNRIFVTTAVAAETAPAPAGSDAPQGQGRGPGGGAGAGREHRFLVLCLDRVTGKTMWERVAAVATPAEGYHRQYGSFASNTPVTDGKNLSTPSSARAVCTATGWTELSSGPRPSRRCACATNSARGWRRSSTAARFS